MRPMWANYILSTDGFIFVVDGKDANRFEEAKRAFFAALSYLPEGHIPPILILLNKFDSPLDSPPESPVSLIQSWINEVGHTSASRGGDSGPSRISVAYASALGGGGVMEALQQLDTALLHFGDS